MLLKRSFIFALASGWLACAGALAQTDTGLVVDDWDNQGHLESDTGAMLFDQSGSRPNLLSRFYSQGRFRFDPSMPLSPSIGYDWTHFSLSSGLAPLPRRLDDLSFAVGSPLFAQGSWFGGATLGFGYAGDESWGSSHGYYGKASAFIGDDLGQGRTLLFTLGYDGNRTFLPDVPLPSVEYDMKFDDRLELAIGLPTSAVIWRPDDRWTFTASYDFPTTLLAEADFKLVPTLTLQTRYVSDEFAFHTSTLPADRRLFYSSDRVELGAEWKIQPDLNLSTTLGYAFGQQFSQGFDDRSLSNRMNLQDRWYVGVAVDFSF
ncbi:MAG: hypothetical protein ACTHLZ_08080 [Tepidisphaeraceae bacterium]